MKRYKMMACNIRNSTLKSRKRFLKRLFSFSTLPPSTNIFSSQQFDQPFNSDNSHPFITISRKFSTILNQSSVVSYFPYGEPDFAFIRRSKQFYVDKTHLIPLLERTGNQLFFVRPPRWGKSLLLSMLKAYYDINSKDQFDELFGGLWIGNPENQTVLRNEYHVLHLDFSIDVGNSPELITAELHDSINNAISEAVSLYELENVRITPNALSSFDSFVSAIKRKNSKLMVLVDEYDRFANKLMFENPDKYKLIVEGKHGDPTSSPIRAFFERLKKASASGLMEFRSLIIGVTPIALADASGYNVAENISQYAIFGDLVGFTENDLRMALNNIGVINDHQNNAISIMKKYYKGYHFPGSTQPLFNPTLSMYFLKKIIYDDQFKRNVVEGGLISHTSMTDTNTQISKNVFATLATSYACIPIIQQLTSTNIVQFKDSIVQSFRLREILDPPTNETLKNEIWDNTLSFMYYHGMLTFSTDNQNMTIPNEIARKQYFSELKNITSLTHNDFAQLYKKPSLDTVKKILENIIGERYIHYDNYFSEGALQHAICCVLKAYFKNGTCYFKVTSEDTINQNGDTDFNQRTDIIMESDKDILIFELKRIRPNGLKWDEKTLQMVLKKRTESKPNITKQQYVRTMNDVLKGKWGIARTVERINEGLYELRENELLDLPLNETYFFQDLKGKKVHHIVEKATQQLTEYVELLKETKKYSKPIHSFVVVQVGTPIIVRQITNLTTE